MVRGKNKQLLLFVLSETTTTVQKKKTLVEYIGFRFYWRRAFCFLTSEPFSKM